MKAYDLMDAVGGIDPQFVENAGRDTKKPSVWKKLLPAAACFALLLGLWAVHPWQTGNPGSDPGRLPAPDPNPNGRIERTPEPDAYPTPTILRPGDPGYEAPGPEPTETAPGEVNSPAVVHAPADQTPTNVTPMISGYGEMNEGCDMVVENGGACLSLPLRAAMEHYGESATYHVMIDLFHDGVQIPADSELAKQETERLFALGYTVAIETVTHETEQGKDSVTYFTLIYATEEQLRSFPPSETLGCFLMLYDEHFGGSTGEDLPVVFNGNKGIGG